MSEEPKKERTFGGLKLKIHKEAPPTKLKKTPKIGKMDLNAPMADTAVKEKTQANFFKKPPSYSSNEPPGQPKASAPTAPKVPVRFLPKPETAQPAIDAERTKTLFDKHFCDMRSLYEMDKADNGKTKLPRLHGGTYSLLRTLLEMFLKDFKQGRLRNGKIITTYSYIRRAMNTSVTERTLFNNISRLEAAGLLVKNKRPWYGYGDTLPDGTPRPQYMNCCIEIEFKSAFIKFDGDRYTMEDFMERKPKRGAEFGKTESGVRVRKVDPNGVEQVASLEKLPRTKGARQSMADTQAAAYNRGKRQPEDYSNPISESLAKKFKAPS